MHVHKAAEFFPAHTGEYVTIEEEKSTQAEVVYTNWYVFHSSKGKKRMYNIIECI